MHALILALLLIAASATANEVSDQLAGCDTCHGLDGVARWAEVPNLSGLPEIVVANSLYDFRGRQRPCRGLDCAGQGDCPPEDMCELAASLSDGQIDLLARRYSSQPFSPAANEYDPALASVGQTLHESGCATCHTKGGSDPLDQASILRGQNTEYLRRALDDYMAGRRLGEHRMVDDFKTMTQDDAEALLNYYASPLR